jgi:hypothetical protein
MKSLLAEEATTEVDGSVDQVVPHSQTAWQVEAAPPQSFRHRISCPGEQSHPPQYRPLVHRPEERAAIYADVPQLPNRFMSIERSFFGEGHANHSLQIAHAEVSAELIVNIAPLLEEYCRYFQTEKIPHQ